MLKLGILRHAKAEDPFNYTDDFLRPLSNKGLKQAQATAVEIKQSNFMPQIILASPALRTASTARIVQNTLNLPFSSMHYLASLYLCNLDNCIDSIYNEYENGFNSILLVGHNPALETLVSNLSNKLSILKPSELYVFQFEFVNKKITNCKFDFAHIIQNQ